MLDRDPGAAAGARGLVPHGSVAVDGVSMTVNAMPASRLVQIS